MGKPGSGRKPKPTAVKKLEGNPGRRPLNDKEPQPQPGAGKPPEYLSREAKREWNRIVPELERIGVLSMVDVGAIAACCQLYGRYVRLERDIAKEGETILVTRFGPEGEEHSERKINPKVTESRQTLIQYRAYCGEFGLTPSSRSRLTVGKNDGGEDDILD